MDNNVLVAILFTLVAGLATAIGGLIVILIKKPSNKYLSFSLGFSAGVMIYVALTEIFKKANDALALVYTEQTALIITAFSFFAGMILIAIIDNLIPKEINPHEVSDPEEAKKNKDTALLKMGVFTAIALAIHNFPEGIATFMSALQAPSVAIPIVVAIAIHNIPEGIAVAMPIYYATGSKWKAFYYSLLSGLTEPIGAIIGYLILMPFLNDTLFGIIFAGVAGIMVYISLDELLPTAEEYGHHHLSMLGVIIGMALMATSIILFL